jgi:hypothetical protein
MVVLVKSGRQAIPRLDTPNFLRKKILDNRPFGVKPHIDPALPTSELGPDDGFDNGAAFVQFGAAPAFASYCLGCNYRVLLAIR